MGESLKAFLAIFMLLPCVALAADECCFKGPGQCSTINSESDRLACEKLPFFVILDSACKEAPECMLSEEEPASKPDRKLKPVRKPDPNNP